MARRPPPLKPTAPWQDLLEALAVLVGFTLLALVLLALCGLGSLFTLLGIALAGNAWVAFLCERLPAIREQARTNRSFWRVRPARGPIPPPPWEGRLSPARPRVRR